MAIKDASLVSSQALHAYGSFLEKSKDDKVVLINSINTETRRISEEWDDKENQKFIDEFDTYISQIANLVELLTTIVSSYTEKREQLRTIIIFDYYHEERC